MLEVEIPKEMNAITLQQYQKFMELDEKSDEDFLMFKMLEIFCNVPIKTASQMPLSEVQYICEVINNVLNEKPEFHNRFEFNGIEYGLVPAVEDMTFGEFVDCENFQRRPKDYHKLAAVLFRRVTKSYRNLYDIEPYTGNKAQQDEFKDLPLGYFVSCMLFFWNLIRESSMDFLIYSKDKAKAMTQLPTLLDDMVGLIQSTASATETLRSLMR